MNQGYRKTLRGKEFKKKLIVNSNEKSVIENKTQTRSQIREKRKKEKKKL